MDRSSANLQQRWTLSRPLALRKKGELWTDFHARAGSSSGLRRGDDGISAKLNIDPLSTARIPPPLPIRSGRNSSGMAISGLAT
jgi:hypothetical protein